MKKHPILFCVVAMLFIVIGAYVSNSHFTPKNPQNNAVRTLFSQKLPDAQGKTQALSQWQGKHLILNFWAPWCAPCVQEMPELSALQKEITAKNIQIIGIGIDSAAHIAEFSEKHKVDYPLYVAGISGAELARQFGNQAGGLPFTVLIDATGQIKKTYIGRLKMEELQQGLLLF
jgi:peroxiredoxin